MVNTDEGAFVDIAKRLAGQADTQESAYRIAKYVNINIEEKLDLLEKQTSTHCLQFNEQLSAARLINVSQGSAKELAANRAATPVGGGPANYAHKYQYIVIEVLHRLIDGRRKALLSLN